MSVCFCDLFKNVVAELNLEWKRCALYKADSQWEATIVTR